MKRTGLLTLALLLLNIIGFCQWNQIGIDIDGELASDQSGYSVSTSDDGLIVAVGAPLNNGINGTASGHVRIYENLNGSWVQVGSDINGLEQFEGFGHSVSLSAAGNRVAVGAPQNGSILFASGQTRIFENINGS